MTDRQTDRQTTDDRRTTDRRQTDDRQTTDRQTNRSLSVHYDTQLRQTMIYNVATVRRLSTKNCKSIHAKLKKIDLCMRSCAPCS